MYLNKVVFILLWCSFAIVVHANSNVKMKKLTQKGERIVSALCDKKKLPQIGSTIEQFMQEIKASKACPSLSKSKLEAVAYYLQQGATSSTLRHINVPKDAKCPVCGMFVSKYPKWSASMKHNGKIYYFDGVKDMMKYYIFDGNFIYDRDHISQMFVSDYYTIESIVAKDAFYVLDSDVYGPMGHELIAFKTQKSAMTFKEEHHGKMIVKFNEITDTMLMALDGIEQ